MAPFVGRSCAVTQIRTLAAHEIVSRVHPRPPPTEADELGRALGKAIDGTLASWTHLYRQGPRLTATAMRRQAMEALDQELRDADLSIAPETRERAQRQVEGTLQAFRKSALFGLSRPRTRLLLVNREWGYYAQPDYWDGQSTFYEMKAYRAFPSPPDVTLQLQLFQLAYPGCRGILASFPRHEDPVVADLHEVTPLTAEATEALLGTIAPWVLRDGALKVLEYVDLPVVHRAWAPSTPIVPLPPKAPPPGPETSEGAI